MNYHDTHFHLDLWVEPEKISKRIEESKIYTIAVTNSPTVFFYTKEIADRSKYIRAALGLHPELVASRESELSLFLDLLQQTRYIGEVGLDNSNKTSDDFNKQKKVFRKILESCANEKNKILTVHSRRASSEVISMIGNNYPGKIILHWYSGSVRELERAIEFGFYFSINYPMTQSESGRKIIDKIPIDRLLVESDGPFTEWNGASCSPLIVDGILKEIILLKAKTSQSSAETILDNFEKILRDEKIQRQAD